MNWETISVIGQLIGTIVVILTLFYIVKQIKLNNTMNRISGTMTIADSTREIHFVISGNRETGELFYKGNNDPESLDEVDRYRFEILWWGILRQMESYFELYREKIIDESAMKSYAAGSLTMINNNIIIKEHWNKNSKDYSPEFKQWINEKLVEFKSETFI